MYVEGSKRNLNARKNTQNNYDFWITRLFLLKTQKEKKHSIIYLKTDKISVDIGYAQIISVDQK